MSTALLLPFARRQADDQLVSPEEVPRGQACNCVCPGCEHPVIAKHGTEKVWHFAHARASDCVNAYEKSVHELAKQLLRERKVILVPKLVVAVSAWDAFGRSILEHETVFECRPVCLESCVCGKPVAEVTPDVFGTVGGRDVLVEITVFHRLMLDKRDRLIETGKASFEIDLSLFKTVQATRELLERELFENPNNRHWIFHPRQVEVAERLQEVLQAKVDHSKIEFAANQELQAKKRAEEDRVKAERAAQFALRTPAIWQAGIAGASDSTSDYGLEWRASFPAPERWEPARAAFCSRVGLSRESVDRVMGQYSKRSHLATSTPQKLAAEWASTFNVTLSEIYRYFREAGYTLD